MSTTVRKSSLQPVRPDELYPLGAFRRISGLGDTALREARRAGLRVIYRHGRGFILGADAIRYLTTDPPSERSDARPPDP